LAESVVDRESPSAALPFHRAPSTAGDRRPRQVFVHYFPFFQNSFDNLPPDRDVWAVSFLAPGGEGGKWLASGGFVRERPLPAGPWQQPYWRTINIAVDIKRAQRMGADGFGLDLVSVASGPAYNATGWAQAKAICQTAAEIAPGFKILIEPDAGILAKASAAEIAEAVRDLGRCPAAARTSKGDLMLAPFFPEYSTPHLWLDVIDDLRREGVSIYFIPDLVGGGPAASPLTKVADAVTDWGVRESSQLPKESRLRPTDPRPTTWMQPIAPQDERPKEHIFWEANNTEMFRATWATAIHEDADYVHLITWNDYGESTEVGPSTGTQFLFYDLNKYFIDWYKTGRPAVITSDAIYYSLRTQIFDPNRPPSAMEKPYRDIGATPVANRIEMLAMLTAPATLEIQIGPDREQRMVAAGLVALTTQAKPGRPVFRIIREGKVILEKVSDWAVDPSPSTANPMYFGGSSTRSFARVQ
jgi:hypothetical protein